MKNLICIILTAITLLMINVQKTEASEEIQKSQMKCQKEIESLYQAVHRNNNAALHAAIELEAWGENFKISGADISYKFGGRGIDGASAGNYVKALGAQLVLSGVNEQRAIKETIKDLKFYLLDMTTCLLDKNN